MTVERLIEGRTYVVASDRARLDWLEPVGPWAWTGKSVRLEPGTRVRYLGSRMGWGSDSVPEDRFATETGVQGAFSPSVWDSADRDSLEELGEWAHPTTDTDDEFCYHPADESDPATDRSRVRSARRGPSVRDGVVLMRVLGRFAGSEVRVQVRATEPGVVETLEVGSTRYEGDDLRWMRPRFVAWLERRGYVARMKRHGDRSVAGRKGTRSAP